METSLVRASSIFIWQSTPRWVLLTSADQAEVAHPPAEMPTQLLIPGGLRDAGVANYVAVVNDLRVPGKYYGHFGALDQGVPQTVQLRMDPALGKVAYALPQGEAVPLEQQAGRLVARVDLPAGGGQVLVLLPERIERLTLSVASGDQPARGSTVRLSAQLSGATGQPVPGVIPLKLTVTNPDGQTSDRSRYGAFTEGRWSLELPVELNALPGTYRAEVTDLAAGHKQSVEWTP